MGGFAGCLGMFGCLGAMVLIGAERDYIAAGSLVAISIILFVAEKCI